LFFVLILSESHYAETIPGCRAVHVLGTVPPVLGRGTKRASLEYAWKGRKARRGRDALFEGQKLLPDVVSCHSPHSMSGTRNAINPYNCLTKVY